MTSKKESAEQKNFDFEHALRKLESIAEMIEDEGTSLMNSMKAFEEGVTLTRKAQEYLRRTEQRLNLLLEEKGEPVAAELQESQSKK